VALSPTVRTIGFVVLGSRPFRLGRLNQARAAWTMRAIAQMKPTISRAIAVVTTTFGLPAAAKRRFRAYSRICALHAMCRITADSGSETVVRLAADPGRHAVCPGSFAGRCEATEVSH
jgi:hypothetical protein